MSKEIASETYLLFDWEKENKEFNDLIPKFGSVFVKSALKLDMNKIQSNKTPEDIERAQFLINRMQSVVD